MSAGMLTFFYIRCYKGTRTNALTVSQLSSVGFSQVTSYTLWEMHKMPESHRATEDSVEMYPSLLGSGTFS